MTFETDEEMWATMHRMEQQANALLLPAQCRLRDSVETAMWWFQAYSDFNIWGRAWTVAECDASSRKFSDDEAEILSETNAVLEARTRGYLFGMAHSIVTPEGELGSTHVSKVFPISEQLFELARAADWNIVDELETAALLSQEIYIAIQEKS